MADAETPSEDHRAPPQAPTSPGAPRKALDPERVRLGGRDLSRWRRWGPFVSERAWGTVREDYSADGNAWAFLPHDLARSKAYRWGEDALAGFCDRYQILVFGLALWNERDPILKERLFGLDPSEGNHGEDVKEIYHHLDATPTHSYNRFLYKYPQRAFPYADLIAENRRRAGGGREYELVDTGVFDGDRYFDITVEYAKGDPEDLAIRITVENHGPDPAPLHVLPQLWFRNTWGFGEARLPAPSIRCGTRGDRFQSVIADDRAAPRLTSLLFDYRLGPRHLSAAPDAAVLFADNETNGPRVFGSHAHSASPFVKDAFHRFVVEGEPTINPAMTGTKCAFHHRLVVPARGRVVLRLRLAAQVDAAADPLADVDAIVDRRRMEADVFYAALHPPHASDEEKRVQRQALAGLLWSKQIYLFDVHRWLEGDNPAWPPPAGRKNGRNRHWHHLNSMRILAMPDKWEYPWFAAWDLAFHAVGLALVDPDFAKEQLWLLLFEQFLHPSGQIPAYEWDFSDLNPPVHAWAVWRVYNMDRIRTGRADREFLETCFHKLLLNFAFWVNRVDRDGNNIFEGGFLGLDNIALFDRSDKLPGGEVLEQSDATGWMGMLCLELMRIALELSRENRSYEGLAVKFFQHYCYVAAAMKRRGGRDHSLWDETDGFFYDVLRAPDGRFEPVRVRSMVGLIPLFAIERLSDKKLAEYPIFKRSFDWFRANRPDLVEGTCATIIDHGEKTHVFAIFERRQVEGILRRLLDPDEFMSPYGVRSLSRHHAAHPFRRGNLEVRYDPAESSDKIKGGNSNWRGPIWFPVNFLMIETLRKLGTAYGDSLRVPRDGRDGPMEPLRTIAGELANRLIALFVPGPNGRRPFAGPHPRPSQDPHFRDHLLFHEYFHGETGEGLGASHQTGWTALVAALIDEWRRPPWEEEQ
jgi:hypothetical protein